MSKAEIQIFSGRNSSYLVKEICNNLHLPVGKCRIVNFNDGEIWVKYNDNIRGKDVYIVQTTNPPADNIMELLIMIDAAVRASANRVTAVIPYFGYARQDRKDMPRVSITAKLVANLLTEAGVDRIITMDLHAPQLQGFFDIPVDHLYCSVLFIKYFKHKKLKNLAVAAPDVGGSKRARVYAKELGADLILIDKRRPRPNVAEVMNIIGEVEGKNVLIIDDLIDTANTFVAAVDALKKAGAGDIYGAATHPILSGQAVEKINNSCITKLVVSNTIPIHVKSPKIEVLDVSKLLSNTIIRTNENQSISALFKVE
ncbi:MAG: ribose-phosphate pyrophosphokinase [Chlorobi bacterium]|nr:ribose-phosphate pyrophosphokinase [Chlorobiota bacterium]MCI0715126.1 ribose-phosphate pyrophosphokinase [Chlorobiota bacterium]